MIQIQMIIFLSLFFGFLLILTVLFALYEFGPGYFRYASAIETLNGAISNKIEHSTQSIIFLVDKNRSGESELPQFLEDPEKSCKSSFKCTITFSTGWNDENSFKVSTVSTTTDSRSLIVGKELHVIPNDRYLLHSHIKLNQYVTNSNILIQGFNETTKSWNEISQCPYSISGPLDWKEFNCSVTIDQNITKMRPIFNAGWSSKENKEAITWFDYLNVTKFKPFLADPNLKTEVVYEGLEFPTSLSMVGPNDFLVIEKNTGAVKRITNGVNIGQPLLQVNVTAEGDSGMLGIFVEKNLTSKTRTDKNFHYVFLYFTTTDKIQEKKYIRNQLYRWELTNNTLNNPTLLLDLPAGYYHNGGPILIGPDNRTLYLSVGDVENQRYKVVAHKGLNNRSGADPDGTAGVLRFTEDGKPIDGGIIGTKYPLNLYYAYGIRESFGMDFDPVTGILWDTENGHDVGDEINMLEPGFNGGWNKMQGIWPFLGATFIPNDSNVIYNPSDLVTFNGKGEYRSPEFTWNQTVGPTALTFLTTDKLGDKYKNDIFVADANYGRIYHFKLNLERSGLLLEAPLADKVADNDNELKDIIFAGNFGLITDLEVGPDGYLYFLVFNEGKVYRIVPNDQNITNLYD